MFNLQTDRMFPSKLISHCKAAEYTNMRSLPNTEVCSPVQDWLSAAVQVVKLLLRHRVIYIHSRHTKFPSFRQLIQPGQRVKYGIILLHNGLCCFSFWAASVFNMMQWLTCEPQWHSPLQCPWSSWIHLGISCTSSVSSLLHHQGSKRQQLAAITLGKRHHYSHCKGWGTKTKSARSKHFIVVNANWKMHNLCWLH